MNDPKPFASLSPTLLARKGGARPAMRPQLQTMPQFQEATARQIEDDLGWNDMGHDEDFPAPEASIHEAPVHVAEIVAINPARETAQTRVSEQAHVPEVVRQQVAIATRVADSGHAERPRRSALNDGRRAAFTLRLDAERHLKLRLACTLNNRSAQQLVTDALDQLIADLPDVATLAAQVKKRS